MNEPSQQLDMHSALNALRKRWRLIALVAILAGGLALGASLALPDRYEATADLLFREAEPAPPIDPTEAPPDNNQTAERIAATNLALASLDKVATRVETRLDIDMTATELRDAVDLEPQGQADIVTITATAGSPREAARIANSFAEETVALRREAARTRIQRVIDAINAAVAETPPEEVETAATLQRRAEQLEVERRLEAGEVEIAEEAVPPREKSSPKPVRNTIIGVLLGLILGSLLALLLQRFDRRVESEQEVADIVGAPILARVPIERSSGWERELFTESFQFLRANLQMRDPEAKWIAITSALPGNGKSTVAAQLAHALALGGAEVIVVDGDLRRPTLHEYFGVSASDGLTTALVGIHDPEEMLRQTDIPGVRLLPAGPLMPVPASVLAGTKGMSEVLTRLGRVADFVIVDTSPVTIGADTSAVAASVDATVMVVDIDNVRRDVLGAATDQLHAARANILGVVLNRAEILLDDHSYRGYYSESGRSLFAKDSGTDGGAPPSPAGNGDGGTSQPRGLRGQGVRPSRPRR